MFIFEKNKGFTLAEVLITIAIIGVIAALNIPTLLQGTNKEEMKVAYKKAFSSANQALRSANMNGKVVSFSGTYGSTGGQKNFDAFKNEFKIIKECKTNNVGECWDMTGELWRSGTPLTTSPAFIDTSGAAWALRTVDGTLLPVVLVDTNGFKKPNKYGIDRFPLMFSNGNRVDFTIDPYALGRYSNTNVIIGEPYQFLPMEDTTTLAQQDATGLVCPNPPCYFTSWLSN